MSCNASDWQLSFLTQACSSFCLRSPLMKPSISDVVAPLVVPALQQLAEERVTNLLPTLQNNLEPSEPIQEGIGQFIAARQLVNRPVTVELEINDRWVLFASCPVVVYLQPTFVISAHSFLPRTHITFCWLTDDPALALVPTVSQTQYAL
ncbi:hypothetical protein BJV74DRAFT_866731 [Russula compacta]|nr:hypothetical protein BJV74DRAFT_866731 [Russula compacta]